MRFHSRRLISSAALLAGTAGLLAGAPAALAQAAPGLKAPGKNTRVSYKAAVDVSMQVKVSTTFESIQKCVPGENASVSYTFDYESARGRTKPTAVPIELLNGAGGTTRPSLGAKGAAVERGSTGAYEISLDTCIPESPAERPAGIDPPQCETIKGRTAVSFATDMPGAAGDDDPAPLAFAGGLVVNRIGGARQNRSCLRLFQETKSVNELFEFNIGAPHFAIGVDANNDAFTGSNMGFAIRIKNFSRVLLAAAGKRAAGTANFKVSGPCYAMRSTASANRSATDPVAQRLETNVNPTFGSARYEKCVVDGSGTVIVRRTTKVTRLKF